ncbi:hypothetical protein [Amycolatopsis orientalis]|uniref:hypothetical protein n=1 Tax=Amycolatopsis orientalis TaxID=31958 RepID=UPI001319EFA8|nr:hypothetical protein [Amycolatopsis orientalis]
MAAPSPLARVVAVVADRPVIETEGAVPARREAVTGVVVRGQQRGVGVVESWPPTRRGTPVRAPQRPGR